MSSCAGDGDGPAVLQLQRWDPLLRSQLELSEFSIASLSPSRGLLLLLSHQWEALLLPLVFGKLSYDDLDKANSQDPAASASRSDSVEIPQCSGKAERVEHCPFICDVKSFAWGHCGDAYNRFEDLGIRELLVVSCDIGIIVHAYRDPSRSEVLGSIPESENVHGKWVEWGPDDGKEAKEVYGTSGTANILDAGSFNRSIYPKKWFRTFLTKLDSVVSDGKYLTRFPTKSTCPKSAEVVSFNIYDHTLKFLEFQSCSTLSDNKKNSSFETGIEQVGTLYRCSNVFSSSSHRQLGFVLSFTENVSTNSSEACMRNESRVLVVVVMVNQFGLQWACSIGLQGEYPGPGSDPGSKWADFQFSEEYLVCLNTSGLVCIYGVTTGSCTTRFNVLESSGLGFNFHSGSIKSKVPVNRDSATNSSEEVHQENEVNGREACDNETMRPRTFRRLMVVSHSLLLAAVDEFGVIYVVWPADYVSKESDTSKKFPHPYKYCGCAMLASWKAAGCKIGGQKILSDLFPNVNTSFSNVFVEGSSCESRTKVTKFRKTECHISDNRSQLNTCPSGFYTSSQISCSEISSSLPEITSRPLGRKVILPLERFSKENSICFSPFGVTRLVRGCRSEEHSSYRIVCSSLHVIPPAFDDTYLDTCCMSRTYSPQEFTFSGESIGFCFQGHLYVVTQEGLSVILPSLSILSHVFPGESFRYWQPNAVAENRSQIKILLATNEVKEVGRSWQIEVLDRTLLFEGPKEAERICLENGWDLKIARVRRMQLALYYLKAEEIEKSLDMLVDVNLAEEGILRLLFTSVYRIFCKPGCDTEVALASRLLTLAASFATKMIRKYGLAQHKKEKLLSHANKDIGISHGKPVRIMHNFDGISDSWRLYEMARFLEVIRNIQSRLSSKSTRLSQELAGGADATNAMGEKMFQDESYLPLVGIESITPGLIDPSEIQVKADLSSIASELAFDGTDKLALSPIGSAVSEASQHEYAQEVGITHRKKTILLENPKNMISRWGVDNIDLKTIVKDALESGRLPLAVLQLHLLRQKELASGKDPHDTFSEISEIGKAIAYDLFLKGESELAVETLLRLGEDLEVSLRQLLFGTVRRSLRKQIAKEMKKHEFLGPHEWNTLEKISSIEGLYPSTSFWNSFLGRQKHISGAAPSFTLPDAYNIQLNLYVSHDFTVECGDIDGVITGSWGSIGDGSPEVCDAPDAAYWTCAAIWSDAWDQRTVDRIMLDHPFHKGVNVGWESQLDYYLSHGDWEDVCTLLDDIPTSLLTDGSLEINLNSSCISPNLSVENKDLDHVMYICASDEIEPVCIDIPDVKIFRSSAVYGCSLWLRALVEQQLAKKRIFLKEYWEDTAEIMALLARAGLIDRLKFANLGRSSSSSLDHAVLSLGSESQSDAEEALRKLVVHYCTQYDLPNLLDLYLDCFLLDGDGDSLSPFLEAAGDCQWAKWLLFSRVKGHEYEASLCNARSIFYRRTIPDSNLSIQELEEIICTVDDIAEGGGEMSALATLMYAAAPMQKCLCAGSVKRNYSFSSQCTVENLRPGLQRFPTLWRTLVAACFGQDDDTCSLRPNAVSVFGKSILSDYLNWRDNIFSSAGGDTSLMHMLPCWFPKSVRRLVMLFIQGPLGWQSLSGSLPTGDYRDTYVINATGKAAVSPINWEISIQRSIEELYSSLQDKRFGVEHHLHRGRALAAFSHILSVRIEKLKSTQQELSGQSNVQSDIQAILAPVTQSEGSLLSSVVPLAIMHFEDSVLAASCAFLLELCGLPASMLRVDLAALRCISSYYKSIRHNAKNGYASPTGSAIPALSREGDIAISLAQTLADNYMHYNYLHNLEGKHGSYKPSNGNQTSYSLMTVVQHLEKACLPLIEEAKTCGYWLSSGNGDGYEFRSKQKDASLRWNMVTTFCHIHQLPPSTKYLALLANDNDWVGYLTEAQMGGFSDDVIIEVAAKEFSDPRLKMHVLTVLKSVQSTRKKTISSTTDGSTSGNNEMSSSPDSTAMVPLELFGLLAECERQKNPGEALLTKAKDLRWSLLAIIASCFADVSPLSCLTLWLEITAARETSFLKVNDISSKIANSVGSAVEATNALLTGSRSLTFHYNRRNAKRRRLMEPASGDSIMNGSLEIPSMSSSAVFSIAEEISSEERNNMVTERSKVSIDSEEGLASLTNMIAVLCEQHLFLPLLRAFDMFLPSCSLLPFIRSLQAFSQMRLSEASAHLASFSFRIKEEPFLLHGNGGRDGLIKTSWISSTAVKAAEAMLSTCPSAYEKRCLLQLLAAADFGDGGYGSAYFRRLYWKINLAEPCLRKDEDSYLGNETLDDASLLAALVANGRWEQARNWARQLESSGPSWKASVHHVTEAQAEAMVVEWREYLWDVPEERTALWAHCQTLFLRYSFPPLQAGLFFLKHAEANEKEIPARDLHEMLLLALQWLSGTMTQTLPVYPLHLLREIETRVWLLAVESESESKADGDVILPNSIHNAGNSASIIEQTANTITKMDNHINATRLRTSERNGTRENNQLHTRHSQHGDSHSSATAASSSRTKRRSKTYLQLRRPVDNVDNSNDSDDNLNSPHNVKTSVETSRNLQMEENMKMEPSVSRWEDKVRPAEVERAILSLLEFGQITAAKQLQLKLSPAFVPPELVVVDAALKVASLSSSTIAEEISASQLDAAVLSVVQSVSVFSNNHIDLIQVLESLATKCGQGCGHGLCRRIVAVVKAAKVLGLTFSEAFEKQPIELLQLLSLKAQDSLEEAKLLVQTHVISPPSIARILAESFLKGLLAAHRGGYMDSQKEEGPAPLLWRFSDFLKWAELCPSEPEIGHALMRLVMTGQDIPHACEVELLILSHHFYQSSACLDGVDVLVTLAANRVESYVSEGDFSCLARLITGVSNFHALNFILNILIENGQLDLLLQKYSTAEAGTATAEAVTGFRMSVLTSLKLFNPHDLDAFAMVYQHFDMKHETAALLESRSMQYVHQWFGSRYRDRMAEDLLEAMRHIIEAAEVYSSIDGGYKTYRACARASLLSLQIRIPDLNWLELSETNSRRAFVEQSRFQEALIVAEAYDLNQPSEWAPVLWNLMLKPDLIEEFVAEFVAVLPLQPSMLLELARFYRAEVAARGDQSHFSVWLSPGGLPAEWVKHLGRSFRSLLKRTRDLRVRLQLATIATGFGDVVDFCTRVLDRVPETAGPLILRRGHGGAYLPLM